MYIASLREIRPKLVRHSVLQSQSQNEFVQRRLQYWTAPVAFIIFVPLPEALCLRAVCERERNACVIFLQTACLNFNKFTDFSSVLSQCTSLTDRRTNRQWDRHTEFSSLDRVCIQCSAVKTGSIIDLLPAALLNCTRRPSDRAFSVAAALVGTVFLAYRFSYWIPYTCHTLVQTGI